MPTYQYACTECSHSFEQVQRFSDDALSVCPQCEGRLRKVYNAVGVVFKGSGFYRTDSRSGGPDGPSANGSSESSAASSESGASTSGSTSDTPAKTPTPAKAAAPGASTGASTGTSSSTAGSTSAA